MAAAAPTPDDGELCQRRVFEAVRKMMQSVCFVEVFSVSYGPKGFHGQGYKLDLVSGRPSREVVDFREGDAACKAKMFVLGSITFGDDTTSLITPMPRSVIAGVQSGFICRHTKRLKQTLTTWVSCAEKLLAFTRLIIGGTPAFRFYGIPPTGSWSYIQERKIVDFSAFYANGRHIGEVLMLLFFKDGFARLIRAINAGVESEATLSVMVGQSLTYKTLTVREFFVTFLSKLKATTVGVEYAADIEAYQAWIAPEPAVPAPAPIIAWQPPVVAPPATRWGPTLSDRPTTPSATLYRATSPEYVPFDEPAPLVMTSLPRPPAPLPVAYDPEAETDLSRPWYPATGYGLGAVTSLPTAAGPVAPAAYIPQGGPPTSPQGYLPSATLGGLPSQAPFGTYQWPR